MVQLKFDQNGLIPAIVQDYKTGKVLMMAYMNKQSYEQTLETGKTVFWSRSREELWTKGETSGNYQFVKKISVDCDSDCLLINVEQKGNACHTEHFTCFYTDLLDKIHSKMPHTNADILEKIYHIVADRVKNPREGSYTNYLFKEGIDKMLKKVGEEAAEVIIAAKNPDPAQVIYEVSDLIYHLIVVLVEQGIELEQIYKELESR